MLLIFGLKKNDINCDQYYAFGFDEKENNKFKGKCWLLYINH